MSEGIANADIPKIEITPEMIEAGSCFPFSIHDLDWEQRAALANIFTAMVKASNSPVLKKIKVVEPEEAAV